MSVEFSQECSWTGTYRWRNGDAKVDLSGCAAVYEILKRNGEIVLSVGLDNGYIKIEALDGDVHFRIDKEDRPEIKPGQYLSRMVLTWPDGTKQCTNLEPTYISKY
jgi:hypothetical protein